MIAACSASGAETPGQTNASTSTPAGVAAASTTEAAAFSCPSSENALWPLPGRNHAYTSSNEQESLVSPDTVSLLEPSWTHEDIGGVSTTPLVIDGVVYYADWLGYVHAADACTGELIWSNNVGDRPVAASLAYDAGTLVASDVAGNVHALRASDGETLWTSRLEDDPGVAGFGAPTIVDGIVVVGVARAQIQKGWRGSIVAFDVDDGSEVWRLYTDNNDPSEGGGVAVWSSAAIDVDRGLGFIGTGNTNDVFKDGEIVPDSPLSTAVLAFDFRTGEVAWVYRILETDASRDFDIGAPPTLFSIGGRDVVGVGGKSGEFVTLDRDTGEEVWRVVLTNGSPAGGVMKGAAYVDGVLFVASNDEFLSDGVMFALDAVDGRTVWRTEVDATFIGHTVTTANGIVYASTMSGIAYGFDASTGETLWIHDLGSGAQSGLSVVAGFVFAGFGGGGPPGLLPTPKGGVVAFTIPTD
jgi:polyvinyl alcohol dehydrogenase (cytochrome)